MKKHSLSLIAVIVSSFCYDASAYAAQSLWEKNRNPQCLLNVPQFTKPLVNGSPNELPVTVTTDYFEAQYPQYARYQGNVEIEQGNRQINAEQAEIRTNPDKSRQVTLQGAIKYQDNLVNLNGSHATMNLATNDLQIDNSQYQLVGRLGRGSAKLIELNKERYIVLKDGSFTTCPIGDNSWTIQGSTVVEDKQEELLEAWNAVFKIGKVPVLYLPYLQYPTGNKRRSGLLLPTLNYDNIDGFRFALPIYWNIAPNYDMTFTPNWIQRRGLQLNTEARYLNQAGMGNLAFEYLNHDDLYEKNRYKHGINGDDNNRRWLFHWDHQGIINNNWRINSNVTRVSDSQYLVDLDSQYGEITDGYLTQEYALAYGNDHWDITLSSKDFQVLREALKEDTYRTQPQLDIFYNSNSDKAWQFSTFAQAVNFTSSGKHNPQTIRLHLEPTVSYNHATSWSFFQTKAALLATYYHQNIPANNPNPGLDSNVTRVIPKLDIDGRLFFLRELQADYTQTLEPRIKYIYKPFRDQSNIKNYDSALLQLDYIGLFRDQLYSGLDRIASANQLSAGLTSRLYDAEQKERFNLSMGQVYYFTQSRTGDTTSALDNNSNTGSLTWATDAFWRLNDDVIMRAGLQYDARLNEIALANGVIEYRPAVDKMLQLSYRYASRGYINAIGINDANQDDNSPYIHDISQLGATGSWPINDSWSMVGAYYYDTKLKRSADNFVGLLYNSCCWKFGVEYGRRITNWNTQSTQSGYENKLSFVFELTGFGRNSNTTSKMLNFGLIPYQSSFE